MPQLGDRTMPSLTQIRLLAAILIIFAMILPVSANVQKFKWPIEKVLLTATFGESRGDHFHSGIDLGGDGQEIRPISDGEVVYYFDEAEHPLYKSFGNGNLMIIQHEQSMRSYYYHMKKASVIPDKATVKGNDIIGITANTGRSFGAHLHLGVGGKKGYINPLSILSEYPDSIKPEIASIMLFVDDRAITVPQKYRVTGIDSFRLLCKTWDSQENIRKLNTLGPAEILFHIDDQLVRRIHFDRLVEKNGRLTLSDGSSFEDIYTKSGFLSGGEYRNLIGLHRFKVVASDFRKNSSSKTVEITFK